MREGLNEEEEEFRGGSNRKSVKLLALDPKKNDILNIS